MYQLVQRLLLMLLGPKLFSFSMEIIALWYPIQNLGDFYLC